MPAVTPTTTSAMATRGPRRRAEGKAEIRALLVTGRTMSGRSPAAREQSMRGARLSFAESRWRDHTYAGRDTVAGRSQSRSARVIAVGRRRRARNPADAEAGPRRRGEQLVEGRIRERMCRYG